MGLEDYFDKKDVRQVDGYCEGCFHLTRVGADRCCDYIGFYDHSRPCPAGAGCTEKTVSAEGKKRLGICLEDFD